MKLWPISCDDPQSALYIGGFCRSPRTIRRISGTGLAKTLPRE
jgi:hypothetical protein